MKQQRNLLITVFCFLLFACTAPEKNENPHISIQTRHGDIELELYAKQAPQTVTAFLRYVDSGYYTNASFYRVLNDENQPMNAPKSNLIQGGIWRSNYILAEALPGIPHESTQQTGILHTDGAISLARTKPGTAGSEFFICIGNQPGFNFGGENNPDGQGYAAFGRVVKGMDVVKSIYHAPEYDQALEPPVDIFRIKRL